MQWKKELNTYFFVIFLLYVCWTHLLAWIIIMKRSSPTCQTFSFLSHISHLLTMTFAACVIPSDWANRTTFPQLCSFIAMPSGMYRCEGQEEQRGVTLRKDGLYVSRLFMLWRTLIKSLCLLAFFFFAVARMWHHAGSPVRLGSDLVVEKRSHSLQKQKIDICVWRLLMTTSKIVLFLKKKNSTHTRLSFHCCLKGTYDKYVNKYDHFFLF